MTTYETPVPRIEPIVDAHPFPLRVGCVDMGSNAIRFAVAEFSSEKRFAILASERRPVRLGHGVYLSGRLDAAAMDGAVATLKAFRRSVDEFGVGHIRAVATSAVRESRNGDELVDRIHQATGIELEVIGGSEEARLVHLAVARQVPLGIGPWLLADLGGGSVEVSLVDADGILWSESHTMGSVRLLEELTEAGTDPGRFRRLLADYISVLKIPSPAEYRDIVGFIATGGNIETLANLAGLPDEIGVSTVSLTALREMIEQLARLSFRDRVEILGLREDRADVVLPAALVYERLADLAGAHEIVVPHVGIKEGVLFDLVDNLVRPDDHEDRQSTEVMAQSVVLGRKYLFDEPHGRHVADLALSVFDQMQSVHELIGSDRRILLAAAFLHDIGQFVSYKAHHKHTLYLLSHSELPSFTPTEMVMVANVARYHRKAFPAEHHLSFVALAEENRLRVTKLAGILRLADALDREHAQRVTGVDVRLGPDAVTLRLSGIKGVLLEGWGLKKKAQLFQKVFQRRLKVEFV